MTNWLTPKNPVQKQGFNRQWDGEPGDTYEVTGVDIYGKRFVRTGMPWVYCKGINLFRGSRWLRRKGRRYLLGRVWNS